jgi:hypothetical protein
VFEKPTDVVIGAIHPEPSVFSLAEFHSAVSTGEKFQN